MYNLFLTLSLFLIVATSCSSDNNDNPTQVDGTWKLTAWNVGESYDLNNDGTASSNLLDEMDCYNNETIVFANNTATYMSTSYADIYFEATGGGSTEGTYTIECEQEIENSPAAYTVSGNTVTITETYEEDGQVYEEVIVATLNGNTLSFVIPDGYYVEDDEFEVLVEQDLTLVFIKL